MATKMTKGPATELYPLERRDEATFSADVQRSHSDTPDSGDEFGIELASVTRPFGEAIVKNALPYLGSRYVWGGTGPSGFDCSGFIYRVLSEASHPISRDHYGQMGSGERVGRSDLEPGDLVFFGGTYAGGLSHSGIYVGDGMFIHAANERTGVIISDLNDSYWAAHYYSATRVG
ncbi:MAG: C40 family peptidase [Chloroflexi bacterium]|nr:C40 family peptidase [Chloroflexota bacterium]